jgi:phosphoglycerate dehydrogenase-like enzyme
MVESARLALLPDGATLINTARGSLVDQDALENELRTGRISAVLDVTEPEVLPIGSALWDLPNLVITPHLAGSVGTELRRMGVSAVAEVLRVVAGQPLRHEVRAAALAALA